MYAVECLDMIALLAVFVLHMNSFFSGLTGRWFTGVVLALCGAYAAVVPCAEPPYASPVNDPHPMGR